MKKALETYSALRELLTCVSLLGYDAGPHTGAAHGDHLRPQAVRVRPRLLPAFVTAPLTWDSGVGK